MRLLDAMDSPADLKRLPAAQLPALAQEIREELVTTIAELGGHLASSLGAVELCLALHYVFDAPADQLVWDMGYQAYTHKLLTGRRGRIRTLKQFGGLTGFNNKDESPYDLFTTGHGGTCLSTAMGLAVARDQEAASRHVAAIIGDASLGEGMALEALNHIGHVKPDLLVVLNDNKMSIAKPVGGLSRYLNRIISHPTYNRMHHELGELISRLPKGAQLRELARKFEESLKGFLVPGMLFEELGFRYVGPIDGHNVQELIATLHNIKQLTGPTLLHVLTLKGKGYRFAEQDPERFHKIEPFDVETGAPKAAASAEAKAVTYTDAFSEELLRLAEADDRIIGITAAMPEGTGLAAFGRRFPERYFDVGMAEQHAVGLAAGLARAGWRPVVAIYSTFLQRAYDQIMHEMCLQRLPVVLVIDRGGLVGEDGPTHHGVFDIGYLRALPHLTVMSPKDPDEVRAMLRAAVARPPGPTAGAGGSGAGERAGDAKGPVAIRYARGGIVCGKPLGRSPAMAWGKAEVVQEGGDVVLFALGSMVYPALEAAARLKAQGIDAAVVNARFVKPLDEALLKELATRLGAIVTLEEGQVAGGFGSAVSETLDAMGVSGTPLLRIGLPDQFVEHGTRAQLLQLCRLDPDSLARRIASWHAAVKRPTDSVPSLSDSTAS